jgi:hypothetical protein
MTLLSKHRDPAELDERLRDAHAVTYELMAEIIGETCRRFPSVGQSKKYERIERFDSNWADDAAALIDLSCRYGRPAESPMIKANGIARYRANASCRTSSTNRSRPAMPIWRWRS